MQRSVWNDIVSWRTRRLSNSTKYLLHASMTTTSKRKKQNQLEKLSKVCSQIVLKCLYLARIGRPDILWSVNKLARSITKWTKACDKRLNRLISYIHRTSEYKQYCHVGNTAKQCRLGLFQDSDFAGDLEDSKSTSGWMLCIFRSHTFVPMSWDMQETNFCFPQFSWCRSAHVRYSRSWSLGFVYWSVAFFFQNQSKRSKENGAGKLAARHTIKKTNQEPSWDSNSVKQSWIV